MKFRLHFTIRNEVIISFVWKHHDRMSLRSSVQKPQSKLAIQPEHFNVVCWNLMPSKMCGNSKFYGLHSLIIKCNESFYGSRLPNAVFSNVPASLACAAYFPAKCKSTRCDSRICSFSWIPEDFSIIFENVKLVTYKLEVMINRIFEPEKMFDIYATVHSFEFDNKSRWQIAGFLKNVGINWSRHNEVIKMHWQTCTFKRLGKWEYPVLLTPINIIQW